MDNLLKKIPSTDTCDDSYQEDKYIDVDASLNCLIVQTRFPRFSYWNLNEIVRYAGFRAYCQPLGLITVAGILPQHWNFKLIDLNIDDRMEISETDWQWADLVCTGGMITQQESMIEFLREAGRRSKFRMVGGADPSSQPEIYEPLCEALTLGEGELSIPLWLDSCRAGKCCGVFKTLDKPDMCISPIPRYDLLDLKNYYMIGVQLQRGCPHHCEFCTITTLFGRKVRKKNLDQFFRELDLIYKLGHRGRVDIVDDNLAGNMIFFRREFLPALISWNEAHSYPYTYSAEVSLNTADNEEILTLMNEARFTEVFVGIETPNKKILEQTHKKINTTRPLRERIDAFYNHGLVVHSGFIVGFDAEDDGQDKIMIDFIRESGVMLAMVGLLVALPNTELYHRLEREGRLIHVGDKNQGINLDKSQKVKAVDQTTGGLNFKTLRDRKKIYEEFINIVTNIYSCKNFFTRITQNVIRLKVGRKPQKPDLKKILAFFKISAHMSMLGIWEAYWYWKTVIYLLIKDPDKIETALNYMSLYLHYRKQTGYIQESISKIKDIDI